MQAFTSKANTHQDTVLARERKAGSHFHQNVHALLCCYDTK